MAELASLWIGESFGEIEIASAKSFLRHGDNFTVYAYEPIANVPDGVTIADARSIMPGDTILRHKKSGSPAIHADLFRYAMIAKTDFIWVDLDVVALRPFSFLSEFIFAYESEGHVAMGVLNFPATSQTLAVLRTLKADTTGVPPYMSGFRKMKYAVRNFLKRGGLPITEWPWAATGPRLMTHALMQNGEIEHTLPIEAFYAIPFDEVELFADPNGIPADRIPKSAYALHLWGKELRIHLDETYDGRAPEGSFLRQMVDM